ncbi:MAG: sodium-independent anion transporter, partial [Lewinella sp.]|nr:sodium-independent anion transporter [Lewinella sp.]
MSIKKIFPLLDWLARYSLKDLRFDLVAGITVSVIAVPQVMAYAQLAGLPPVYGLYASITPLIVYALFGTSPQLSVGPTAVSALLVLTGIGALDGVEPGTELFVTMALAAAFLSGVIQLLFGVFRLGILVNFLSRPVIYGFSSAAAVLIFLSQLKYLLGVQVPRSSGAYEMVVSLVPHVMETNGPTLLLGLITLLILLVFKRWLPRWPGALLVMIVTTAVVFYGGFMDKGIAVVGNIQRGLPHFQWPFAKEVSFILLVPTALTIALMSFVESLAISKTIESRHGDYRIEPNQELAALGWSKIVSSFFQSFPTSGSFSRSAINDFAGARTGVASIISAILIALVLLYLTPVMYFLPQAVLAAVITVAVYSLLEWKQALYLWRTERRDFLALI